MRIENNVPLSKLTTFHVGGTIKNLYYPVDEAEIVDLIRDFNSKGTKYRIISGGSNVLANDKCEYEAIINMRDYDGSIKQIADDVFSVGAGRRIQEVIRELNEVGFGGFEELFSLPALVGGIVYMNAGIGNRTNPRFNFSDFVLRVKVLEKKTGNILWLTKDDCHFDYRESIFQNDEYIILAAEIKPYHQDCEISKKRIDDRLEHCRKTQEWGNGCFGSLCSAYTKKIQLFVKKLPIHRKIYQSDKNPNWLVNKGNGTFSDAMRIIKYSSFFHKLCGKKFEVEVRIWDD